MDKIDERNNYILSDQSHAMVLLKYIKSKLIVKPVKCYIPRANHVTIDYKIGYQIRFLCFHLFLSTINWLIWYINILLISTFISGYVYVDKNGLHYIWNWEDFNRESFYQISYVAKCFHTYTIRWCIYQCFQLPLHSVCSG